MKYNSHEIDVRRALPSERSATLSPLTDAQKAAIPVWREAWVRMGTATATADRATYEDAVVRAYRAFDYAPPKEIIWVEGIMTLRDKVQERCASESWRNFSGGAYSLGWTSYCTFLKDVCGIDFKPDMDAKVEAFRTIHESGGYFFPTPELCICVERPHIFTMDDQQRLHNTHGPALGYRDKFGLYYAHGVNIPGRVIKDPGSITVDEIEAQDNQEVKRVFIEQYGVGRYLQDGRWKLEHKDSTGELYVRPSNRRDATFREERMVRVWNGTVEHGGRIREFILPVHPELRPMSRINGRFELGEPQKPTARAAVASTYGLRAEDYVLALRT